MKAGNKDKSKFLRKALRRYIKGREWQKIYHYGEMRARGKKVTEDQIEDIIDARRN